MSYNNEQFARECLEGWQESLKTLNKDIKRYREQGEESLLKQSLKHRRWHYRTIKHWKSRLKE